MRQGNLAITFDVDRPSLGMLREALPGWQINSIYGGTVATLPSNWTAEATDFFIVAFGENVAETLALCRFLAFCASCRRGSPPEGFVLPNLADDQAPRPDAPILVLVPPGQEDLVEAVLRTGAHSCLMLPIHSQDVAAMLRRARAGNQPGRHTLHLEPAQSEDHWRDEGGQG